MVEDEGRTQPPPSGDQETQFASAGSSPLGQRIGPYKLLDLLGEGGFGVVYLAEQTEPVRRRVALKIIKPGMDSKAIMARFEAERQALAIMDHPHVARVFDAGTTETGIPYFVMEHVRGLPITEFCDSRRLNLEHRLQLFVQVCQAVQHAHSKGIIHRDIKPSNILVEYENDQAIPKVIDFGVAKALNQRLAEDTIFTQHGQIIGTPEYMSPEQAEMSALDIDTRSDVYSLGVLLYELLTGSRPFELKQRAMYEFQRIIREEEPPRPSTKLSVLISEETAAAKTGDLAKKRHTDPRTLTRKLRGDLDWIVMKCLEKDPTRRYDTANGVAMDLRRYLADEPVLAGPPSAAYRFRKFAKRNKGLITAATAVFVTMIGGLVFSSIGFYQAAQQRDRAEAAAEDSEAVTSFLVTMLRSADPHKTGTKGTTVREVLEKAAPDVEMDFRDRPLIEARLRRVIGLTYHNLAIYELSMPHLTAALQLRRDHLGDRHRLTMKSMTDLAMLHKQMRNYDEAKKRYEEVLPMQIEILGEAHDDTLWTMNNFANVHQAQKNYTEAEKLKVKVLELRLRDFGEQNEATLAAMHNLGTLYYNYMGDLEKGEEHLAKALELKREFHGPEHVFTLKTETNLGGLYCRKREFEKAIPLLQHALKTQRDRLEANDPDIIVSLYLLGEAYLKTERFAESVPMFEEVYGLELADLGPEHGNTLDDRGKLAEAYLGLEQFETAEEHALGVHTVWLGTKGPKHDQTVKAVERLIDIYEAWEKPDEVATWREKLPMAESAGSDDDETP